MKKRSWILGFLVAMLFFPVASHAQEKEDIDAEDILGMSLNDLMNVQVVTASKFKQNVRDVAATVRVISAEQIRDRGYFTLEEALSDLPGFQFRNIVGFNSYVFMRGATSQNNLILLLVDGVQINELNSGGFYAGGQFNLSDVEQIEVVYGPASALYGTNAVSGIINIITRKPQDSSLGHVSALGGSFSTGLADFNVHHQNESTGFGYSVSVMYKTSEKADLRGAQSDYNWTDNLENFENDWSVASKINFGDFQFGLTYQDKQSSNATYHKSYLTPYDDRGTLWNIGFLNGYLKYDYTPNDRWSLNSKVYYRNSTVRPNTVFEVIRASDSTSGDQTGYYRPNSLLGMEHQFNFSLFEGMVLTAGVSGEMEWLSNAFSISHSNNADVKPPRPSDPAMIRNYLFSDFVQVSYELPVRLSIVGGFRHDLSSYYGSVITPRLGLVYHPDNWTAKLLYNTAFRAPRPWDFTSGLGNPNLEPEKMRAIEGSLSYALTSKFSAGVALYENKLHNKFIKEHVADDYRWINKDEVSTHGVEVFGQLSLNPLFIDWNYTYNNSRDQDGNTVSQIAPHSMNAGITLSFLEKCRAVLRVNYLGERTNPTIITATGNYIVDDALLFHTAWSYLGWKNFDFQIRINNLFNQEYYHPSNLFDGRCRQPQRTVQFKVTRHF